MIEGFGIIALMWLIFFIILAWTIIYGILEYTKVMGGNKNLNSIIALMVAILLSVSHIGRTFLAFTIPWIATVGMIIFFILLLFRFFGIKEDKIIAAGKSSEVITWVLIVVAFILFFGMGKAFSTEQQVIIQQPIESSNPPLEQQPTLIEITPTNDVMHGGEKGIYVVNIFRSPAVLGAIVIIFISAFAVIFLTKPVNPH